MQGCVSYVASYVASSVMYLYVCIGTYEEAQQKEAEIIAMLENGKAIINKSTGKLEDKVTEPTSEKATEKNN